MAIAHGQMDEAVLEQVVLDFWDHRYDVMVCTTIIESGIDMPTVNTLIVDRADLMGLAQLHQIRGRVGRAQMRAYAYLFTPPERSLTTEAYERLKVVAESTELGSGIRIAMRDLEIRGAGNLLGVGQSGHIAAVGYDLYCEMVTEAGRGTGGRDASGARRGDPRHARGRPTCRPTTSPRNRCGSPPIAASPTIDGTRRAGHRRARRVAGSLRPLPAAAEALLGVARLRVLCIAAGVTDVTVRSAPGGGAEVRIAPLRLRESRRVRLERLWPSATYEPATERLRLPLRRRTGAVEAVTEVLEQLADVPSPAAAAPPAA